MKKALSLVLAIVFMFALAIPAFAANVAMSGATQDVTATYTVAQAYTVSIPSGINFDAATKRAQETVTVNGALVASGSKVVVELKAANSDNTFELEYIVDEEVVEALAYTINYETTEVVAATGTDILVVEAGDQTGSVVLDFAITDEATFQGTYTDTLTFTAGVE